MIIGIPKEIKNNEFRVGITPSGANTFVKDGHTVYLQKGAGLGSGFSDVLYKKVGAKILDSIEEIYSVSELIIKVKEPLEEEYSLIKKDQIISLENSPKTLEVYLNKLININIMTFFTISKLLKW